MLYFFIMSDGEVEIIYENVDESTRNRSFGAAKRRKFTQENAQIIKNEALLCIKKRFDEKEKTRHPEILGNGLTGSQNNLSFPSVKHIRKLIRNALNSQESPYNEFAVAVASVSQSTSTKNKNQPSETHNGFSYTEKNIIPNSTTAEVEVSESRIECQLLLPSVGVQVANGSEIADVGVCNTLVDPETPLKKKETNVFSVSPVLSSNVSSEFSSPLVKVNNNPLEENVSGDNSKDSSFVTSIGDSKRNGCKSDESPCSSGNIKLSRHLQRHANKFSVNGSPVSSSKNRNLVSNSKISPKRSPKLLSFLKTKSSAKRGHVDSVKRKLTFANNSSDTQSLQESLNNHQKEELEPTASISNDNRPNDGYVYRQLKSHVDEVLADDGLTNLIDENDKEIISLFFNMDQQCRDWYARMLNRKLKWNRLKDISYNSSSEDNVKILLDNGFLITDVENVQLETLLGLLKMPELKELCKSLGIKCKVPNKQNYIENILCYCRQQKTITFSQVSSLEIVKERIKNGLGTCFILTSEPRQLFRRIHLLYNLKFSRNDESKHDSQDLFDIQFFGTYKGLYPHYTIDKTAKIFGSRNELLRFQTAEDLKAEYFVATENKNWSQAEEIIGTIRNNFVVELGYFSELDDTSSCVRELPLSLRKFTAGAAYAYILSDGVEVLKRLKKRDNAISDLLLLLDQTMYLPYMRGRWYEKLLTIYRGQIHEVAATICKGIKDSYVDNQGLYLLSYHCRKLLRKKKGVSPEIREMLRDIPLFPPLEYVEPVEINACALEGKAGYKRVYIQEDDEDGGKTYSSVEELVINHYCPRVYKRGIHAENRVMVSLFGILFWDVIYDHYVPCAFVSPYQTKPLDLSTEDFYKNRKAVIDKKLMEMANWTEKEIAVCVNNVYENQYGAPSIVQWKWFHSAVDIINIITCIGLKILLQICEKYAKDYRGVRKGFPDLFLWTPGEANKYKFVEVKGPNDRLNTNQKLWLDSLVKLKANVEVCLVKAKGSKSAIISCDMEPDSN